MAEALRILQVLRAPVGGLFRHVSDLTRGLVKRGHAVGLVIEDTDAGPRWERVVNELAGIATLGLTRVPMARRIAPSDMWATQHILKRLKAERIDVVHGHGAKGGAYGRIAAALIGRSQRPARIYTPHGGSLHFPPGSREGRLYHTLERVLAKASEAIVFESEFAKQGFAETLDLASAAWPVIHNGLAPAEFEPVALASNASDIVYIGEMRALKGVDVLIDALEGLPGVSALLVGAGPDEAAYRARTASLGGRIRFAAPMPAHEAFSQGRVVIVPSRKESLPYLVLEAAAAGRPLIATRVGGIPEIVGPEAASLVPAEDIGALAAAIEASLANPAAAAARAERVRAYVREHFDIERMVDAIEELYRACLARRR